MNWNKIVESKPEFEQACIVSYVCKYGGELQIAIAARERLHDGSEIWATVTDGARVDGIVYAWAPLPEPAQPDRMSALAGEVWVAAIGDMYNGGDAMTVVAFSSESDARAWFERKTSEHMIWCDDDCDMCADDPLHDTEHVGFVRKVTIDAE